MKEGLNGKGWEEIRTSVRGDTRVVNGTGVVGCWTDRCSEPPHLLPAGLLFINLKCKWADGRVAGVEGEVKEIFVELCHAFLGCTGIVGTGGGGGSLTHFFFGGGPGRLLFGGARRPLCKGRHF